MSVIEAYIAELDRALRGPRRVKADLLTEGRDSLVDAADLFEDGGLGREAAERMAVEEFGEIREIAPGYQAELAVAQARRTALLVAVTLAVQQTAAEITWRSLARHWDPATIAMGRGYRLLAGTVDRIGIATIALSLLVALAFGIGVRYLGARPRLIRVTGLFALTVDGFFVAVAAALTFLNPHAWSLTTGPGLWALCAFSMIPAALIATSGRRCLRVA